MKYRITSQDKSDGRIRRHRPPVFDSYESADSEAKRRNKECPESYYWAEAAPETEAQPFFEDWPTEIDAA